MAIPLATETLPWREVFELSLWRVDPSCDSKNISWFTTLPGTSLRSGADLSPFGCFSRKTTRSFQQWTFTSPTIGCLTPCAAVATIFLFRLSYFFVPMGRVVGHAHKHHAEETSHAKTRCGWSAQVASPITLGGEGPAAGRGVAWHRGAWRGAVEWGGSRAD